MKFHTSAFLDAIRFKLFYSILMSIQHSSDADIFPPEIKSVFMPNATLPNLDDYDVIGFDVDHTLCKYNITYHVRKIIENALTVAHQSFGYPKEILDFDYVNDIGICFDGAVWDIVNERIIKLGEGKRVMRAYFGFEETSQEQIKEIYGNPPVFEDLKFPEIDGMTHYTM